MKSYYYYDYDYAKMYHFLSAILTSLHNEAVNRGAKYDLPSGRAWRPLDAKFQRRQNIYLRLSICIYEVVFLHESIALHS